MKLITYLQQKQEKVGVLLEDQVVPLPTYVSMQELIEQNTPASLQNLAEHLPAERIPLSEVRLLAPIPRPLQDVICLGTNYRDHAEEAARFKKETFASDQQHAIYFSKRVDQAVAPGAGIPAHQDLVDSLDYEVELAVIISQDAYQVAKSDVTDYIFGYTIINDVSARNVQMEHKQWYFGKSLAGFLPMGPCITTADEIIFPPQLEIQSLVNGELRQNANTELLIFDIAHIISELSQGMVLKAGTIIATGTPAGVGMGFEPPKFLQIGDQVECRIEKIGSLINPIIE